MRGAEGMKPVERAKEKVTKARVSMRSKEDEEAKERNRRCRARKMRRTRGS